MAGIGIGEITLEFCIKNILGKCSVFVLLYLHYQYYYVWQFLCSKTYF